jgi:hypothetical protein
MARSIRLLSAGSALALVCSMEAAAQQPVSGVEAISQAAPGWTLTPGVGFMGTYDDNITLFARGSAEDQNDDLITGYAPQVDLTYRGRKTQLGVEYAGSFLNYQTFSVFNRWQQRARVEARRDLTQRLQLAGHASMLKTPSTDAVDLGGIPFSHTGAEVVEWLAETSYRISARDSVSSSIQQQNVRFERPEELRQYLRGGRALGLSGAYRRRLGPRMAAGADYGFRRAAVRDDVDTSSLHTVQAAFDFELSPAWTIRAGAGFVFLAATSAYASQRAPAFNGSATRIGQMSTLQVGYGRSFMPSFGYGGTVRSQELGASYRTLLPGSRRVYTNQSVMFRDTNPLLDTPGQLRLRSLRTNSAVGWTPQPWVALEVFYSRTFQTSLLPGGRLDRNRIGFQIVTSKPVRIQ